jgi:hypothetical protein
VSGVEKDNHKTSADLRKPPLVYNPVAASDETLTALNKFKSLQLKRSPKTTMNGGMGGNKKHERVDGDEDNDINPVDNDNDDASTKSLLVLVWDQIHEVTIRRPRRVYQDCTEATNVLPTFLSSAV